MDYYQFVYDEYGHRRPFAAIRQIVDELNEKIWSLVQDYKSCDDDHCEKLEYIESKLRNSRQLLEQIREAIYATYADQEANVADLDENHIKPMLEALYTLDQY